MALINLLLVLVLLATNELAESDYGFFSATNAMMMLAMAIIALSVFGVCWLVGWITSRWLASERIGTVNGMVHAIIVVLVVLYGLEDPLPKIHALTFFLTSQPIAGWVLPLLSVCGLTLALRRLPVQRLGTFFSYALSGALLVAVLQAALSQSGQAATILPIGTAEESQSGIVPNSKTRPNVYYIVLDSHAGLPAFPTNIRGSVKERERLRDDYTALGFDIHELAFTNFFWTALSLYSIFDNQISETPPPKQEDVWSMPRNKLFDHFFSLGYEPLLYYSDYINMCEASGVSGEQCRVYHVNSLSYDLPANQKIPLLLSSILYRVLGTDLFKQKKRFFGVANAVGMFDQMISDVKKHRTGKFVLAHIMLPHEPFVLSQECRLRDENIWSSQIDRHYVWIDPAQAKRHWERYLPQVACTHSLVLKLVATLKEEGLYDEATIIIHGDHGSRISMTGQWKPMALPKALPPRIFLDFYSTFFAVKRGSLQLESPLAGRDYWASVSEILSGLMGWEPGKGTAFPYRESGDENMLLPRRYQHAEATAKGDLGVR